jgi:hypothetical protein
MGKTASRAVSWVTGVKPDAVMIRGRRAYLLLQQEIEEE